MLDKKQQMLHISIFFLIGLTMPIIGILIYKYDISIEDWALRSRFLGALIGAIIIGITGVHYRFLPNVYALMIITVLSLSALSQNIFIIPSHFALGFSTTGLIILFSQSGLQHERQSKNSIIIIVQQFAFGLGAMVTPLLLIFIPVFSSIFQYMGGLVLLFSGIFLYQLMALDDVPIPKPAQDKKTTLSIVRQIVIFLPLYLCVFFYAGVENGLNVWLYTWLQHTIKNISSQSQHVPLMIIAIFWLCLTLGRLLMIFLAKKIPTFNKTTAGIYALGTAIVSSALLAIYPHIYVFIITLAISLGPLYPTFLSLFSQRYPLQGIALSLVTFASTFGSITLATYLGKYAKNNTNANILPLSLLIFLAVISLVVWQYRKIHTKSMPIIK